MDIGDCRSAVVVLSQFKYQYRTIVSLILGGHFCSPTKVAGMFFFSRSFFFGGGGAVFVITTICCCGSTLVVLHRSNLRMEHFFPLLGAWESLNSFLFLYLF